MQWCAVAGILVKFTGILGGIYHSRVSSLGGRAPCPHDTWLYWVNWDYMGHLMQLNAIRMEFNSTRKKTDIWLFNSHGQVRIFKFPDGPSFGAFQFWLPNRQTHRRGRGSGCDVPCDRGYHVERLELDGVGRARILLYEVGRARYIIQWGERDYWRGASATIVDFELFIK